ncbi:hypothetical protein [Agromyces sp. NPDC058126]|uniref:hypothetical protein n=1 Tax=Agromyces sp. NPDC058126 TaxID=3346350 RepID=UPI0036DDA25C
MLATHGPLTKDELVEIWRHEHPGLPARAVLLAPSMVGKLLWRLNNLGWAALVDGHVLLTDDGRRMLDHVGAATSASPLA